MFIYLSVYLFVYLFVCAAGHFISASNVISRLRAKGHVIDHIPADQIVPGYVNIAHHIMPLIIIICLMNITFSQPSLHNCIATFFSLFFFSFFFFISLLGKKILLPRIMALLKCIHTHINSFSNSRKPAILSAVVV